MKKSKFLKKSLAMLLAVMLVVAMIPLSAAAAVGDYTPVGQPTLAAGDVSFSEDPAVSGNTYTVVFNYSPEDSGDTVSVVVRPNGTGEKVRYLTEDGTYETEETPGSATIELWENENGTPADVTFWIVDPENANNYSNAYTIKWSMEAASTEATVVSAKLDDYTGVVDNAANTVKFTVPYGSASAVAGSVEIKTNDTATATDVSISADDVETNKTKGNSKTFTLTSQQGTNPETYTVTVVEADALTAISLGDVKGEFEIAKEDGSNTLGSYNKGYETGIITFNMPAGTKTETVDDEEQLMLVPTFTIGSAYEKVELGGEEIKSGEEFNFADLLEASDTGMTLTITDPDDYTITYTLKMVVDQTSTAITGFTVTDDKGFEATGTVSGTALSAQLSSEADLEAVTTQVVFNVPAKSSVTVGTLGAQVANADGEATVTLDGGYTAPMSVKVVSADGSRQAFYTLTLTKAEAANKNPQITSGKLTITNDDGTKSEYTASISGTTITFTVPYSTTNDQVEDEDFYTWAKTAQTTNPDITLVADTNGSYFGDKANNTVEVSSDGGDVVTYKLVINKEAAKTGKSISDFVLTMSDNVNLMEVYENYTYDVTASGTQFNVTMPQWFIDQAKDSGTLNTTFTLSEGAALYSVDKDSKALSKITSIVDEETGDITSTIDTAKFFGDGQQYVIADEYLAYDVSEAVVTGNLTTIQNTAKYDNHYTVYTVKATGTERTGTSLTSLTANDGLVTSTISGRKVTINVPASYVDDTSKAFFFDYKVSDGALLSAGDAVLVISGGMKDWEDGKMIDVDADGTVNPNFTVVKVGDEYELRVYDGSDYDTEVSALTVTSENGMPVDYTVEVKVNAAETGALLTSVKVGNTNAVINNTAKTVTVALPYGTNLGAQELTIEASKLATVTVGGYASFENGDAVSLVRPLKITVVSEDNATTNVYTLTATTASQFTDVQPGDWFYQNVMDAVAAGIVSGRGDGTFGPNDRITRRDFAIMVSKLLLDGEDAPEATTTPFSDVAANDYGLNAIAYCAENGIISGFDGEFRPSDNITRQEAASVMKNALELTGTTSELFADDAAIATWAKANVYACKAAGVFNGDDHNNFNPTSTLTRAEAASIMVNAMK